MVARRFLSRRLRAALAVAALAVVAVCVFTDLKLRPSGVKRDGLWGVGLIAYAVLLNVAIGPAVDQRGIPPPAAISEPTPPTVNRSDRATARQRPPISDVARWMHPDRSTAPGIRQGRGADSRPPFEACRRDMFIAPAKIRRASGILSPSFRTSFGMVGDPDPMNTYSSETPDRSASSTAKPPESSAGPRGLVPTIAGHPLRDFILLSAAALGCFALGIAVDVLLDPSPSGRTLLALAAFAGYLILGRRALIALAPEIDRRWRREPGRMRVAVVVLLLSAPATRARAQQSAPAPEPNPVPAPAPASDAGKVNFGGYVEAFYSYNFNTPSNRITNYRGFDNRESTFTLSNLDLSAAWEKGAASGKVSLQVGHTPNTYYLSEPAFPGTSATSSTDASTWKYVQEAWVGYKAGSVLFKGGLFLSPIGVEGIAVKDNWNWSRSNLFFGLPFYHTGVSATSDLSKQWTMTLMICNGWNNVVDDNKDKSVDLEATFKPSGALTIHGLYFGGVERPTDAPEGSPWRNLFDLYATWDATPTLSFILSGDAGWENNNFGTSSWEAAAGYVRVKLSPKWSVAARADVFWEHVPSNAEGTASAIFWPADRVASQTLTLDYHPQDNISIRLEGRHDGATGDMYFKDRVQGDGSLASPYIPNAKAQTTVTLGVTTWF